MSSLTKTTIWAFLWGVLLAAIVPYALLSSRRGWHTLTLGPVRFLGILPLALGTAMCVWSVYSFATAGRGTPAPWDPPRRLVVMGFFRYVRNPIYVGALLILTGEALVLEAWSLPLLGLVALNMLGLHLLVVYYEEPILRKTFGTEYEEYLKTVPRWLPRLR